MEKYVFKNKYLYTYKAILNTVCSERALLVMLLLDFYNKAIVAGSLLFDDLRNSVSRGEPVLEKRAVLFSRKYFKV